MVISAINETTLSVTFSDSEEPVEVNLDTPLVDGQVTVTFTYNEVEYSADLDEAWVAPAELAVETVSAIDETGVTVTFTALEEAMTGANVTVTNPAGETVATTAMDLEAGATEATFAFDTALDVVSAGTWTVGEATYEVAAVATTVTVEAVTVQEGQTATPVVTVLDQDGNEMADQTVTYASSDETVFTVAADGTVTGGTYVEGENTATLTATAGEVEGTATVTVSEDTVDPTIESVAVIDKNHIKVTFSEKVTKATAEDETNYGITKISAGPPHEDPALAVLGADGKTVTLTLTTALVNSTNGYSLTIENTGTDIADLAGNTVNTGDEMIFSGVAGTDTTAPDTISASYDSYNNQVTVNFNEKVDVSVIDLTKLSINDVVLGADDEVETAVDGESVVITLSDANATSVEAIDTALSLNYELGAFTDLSENEIEAGSIAVSTVKPPELQSAAFDANTNELTLVFNETIDVSTIALTAVTLTNDTTDIALDADSEVVTEVDGTTVVIAVDKAEADSIIAAGNQIPEITTPELRIQLTTAFADSTGEVDNVAVGDADDFVVTFTADETAPTLTAATYTITGDDAAQLKLVLSEKVSLTDGDITEANMQLVDEDGVVITDLATVNPSEEAAGDMGDTLTYVLNATVSNNPEAPYNAGGIKMWEGLKAAYEAGKKIYVVMSEGDIKDGDSNDIAALEVGDFELTYNEYVAPQISATAALDNTHVQITFDEPVSKADAEDTTNYTIYRTGLASETVEVTGALLQADKKNVILSTGALNILTTNGYTVKVEGVTDLQSNVIQTATDTFTGTTDTNDTAFEVTGVTFATAANANNDTIEIQFTNDVDANTALVLGNYTLEDTDNNEAISLDGATIAQEQANGTYDANYVTITLDNGVNLQTGTNYELTVGDAVKDIYGASIATEDTNAVEAAAAGDGVAPTIDGVAGSTTPTGDKIVVTLSEAVTEISAETAANWTVVNDVGVGNTDITADADSITYTETDSDEDGTVDTYEVTFMFAADTLTGTISVDSKDATHAATDLAGNLIANGDVAVQDTAIADGVAPTIESVVATTNADKENDTIVITFSEDVVDATAELISNWTITDSQGNELNLTGHSFTYNNADPYVLTILLDSTGAAADEDAINLVTGETYTVAATGVIDDAGNELTGTASDVAEGDDTAPTIATVTPTAADVTIDVVFTEDVDADTISRKDFTVVSDADGDLTDASDQTSYVISTVSYTAATKTATITLVGTLPATDTDAATDKVKVTINDVDGGVSDLAGNVQDDTNNSGAIN